MLFTLDLYLNLIVLLVRGLSISCQTPLMYISKFLSGSKRVILDSVGNTFTSNSSLSLGFISNAELSEILMLSFSLKLILILTS